MHNGTGNISWDNVYYMMKDARSTKDYIALQKHMSTNRRNIGWVRKTRTAQLA